ncbi:helix-turn-helix domain-containing protein [Amycolatopsis australiensis]|uniref:Regulatory protein, luxR family n=1 Tax=Amycolatopsis australiensis TaxID=546364 RepID=A0A1K1RUI5_9PSEU|nr:helix-turn-helix transcriptional regulator [Amycolatopsis australiensis]SFW75840.1 regulatory protein, luxR family [Amycolatopsis australiensis]
MSDPAPQPVRTGDSDALSRWAAQAWTESAQAVLVDGTPGGGVRALLSAFESSGTGQTANIVRLSGRNGAAYPEFHALAELFAGAADPSGDIRRALELPAGNGSALHRKFRTLRFLLLSGLLREKNLVIVVEEAQWCDESSLRFFDFLLRCGRGERFLLVLCRRPEEPGTGSWALGQIGAQDRCHRWEVTAASPVDALAALPAQARTVATAVAVLDDQDVARVAALCGLPAGPVRIAIIRMRRENLFTGSVLDRSVRSRLLAETPADELACLHLRAARVLNDDARPAAEVAPHLGALPRLEESWMLDLALEAAAAAKTGGNPEAAVTHLTRAAATEPSRLDVRLALAAAHLSTNPQAAMAELTRAAAHAEDERDHCALAALYALAATAAGTSEAGGAAAAEGRAAAAAGGAASAQGGGAAATPGGRSAPANGAAIPLSDPSPLPASLGDLVDRLAAGSPAVPVAALAAAAATRDAARSLLRDRAVAAPRGSVRRADARDLAQRALGLALAGRSVEVAAACARAVVRLPVAAASSADLLAAGRTLRLVDDLPNAVRALDQAVAEAVVSGDRAALGRALAARYCALRESGDRDGALADVRVAALAGAGERPGVTVRGALAIALRDDDQLTAAEHMLRAVRPHELDDAPEERPLWLLGLARIRALRSDVDGALELLREAGRYQETGGVGNPVFAPWWFTATLLLAGTGRHREAAAYAERGHDLATGWPTGTARGLVLLGRGVAASGTRAVELLADAGRVLAASPCRVEYARAEYLLGKALTGVGDRKTARQHLRQAALLSACSGWRSIGALARELLEESGGRLRRPRADVLTLREREVAELVAGGASNRDVAGALFVSPRTVELHLTNVYRKLTVDSRAELAAALRGSRPAGTPKRTDGLAG